MSEHELPESARWEAAGEGEGEEGILGSNVDGKGKEKPTGEKSTAEKPEVKPNQGLAGPAPPVAPAAAGGSGPKVDEGKVTTLMELGATREEAIRALECVLPSHKLSAHDLVLIDRFQGCGGQRRFGGVLHLLNNEDKVDQAQAWFFDMDDQFNPIRNIMPLRRKVNKVSNVEYTNLLNT